MVGRRGRSSRHALGASGFSLACLSEAPASPANSRSRSSRSRLRRSTRRSKGSSFSVDYSGPSSFLEEGPCYGHNRGNCRCDSENDVQPIDFGRKVLVRERVLVHRLFETGESLFDIFGTANYDAHLLLFVESSNRSGPFLQGPLGSGFCLCLQRTPARDDGSRKRNRAERGLARPAFARRWLR